MAPAVPQLLVVWLANGVHVVLLLAQQPFAHEVALQTQAPLDEQAVPVAHGLHIAPPMPQVLLLDVWQRLFESQQPFGQEVALQTQAPPEQVVFVAQVLHMPPPVPQVGFVPGEWHCPVGESQQPLGQEEALQTQVPPEQVVPVAQGLHLAPPVPQAWSLDGVWHWPLSSQQPLGQEAALQTHAPCALQAWFAAHGRHMAPLAPHAVGDVVVHWPFEQQPLQLAVPQLHAPLLHAWPVEHFPHEFPLEPHALPDCADSATQCCWLSQQPFGHDDGVQAHTPVALQVWSLAQGLHMAPAAPQVLWLCDAYGRQVPSLLQQPFGQEVASHAHLPCALHA
jgi:hypothetical protein